ncbi:hypothetical protein T12_14626 [Trichinella patagoniensis]|uniref:FLYWCH-type domain-containing protein n=1 Tax=Trichinella patagoniensis TaxID=990121 RepID=A0A0V0Z777_9BILA|nr:hypothetical protein T12_14626 [Trichinella patagoniensis]
MANLPELHLVQNRCGGTSLVYEGRAYKLKRAARKKYWRCSQVNDVRRMNNDGRKIAKENGFL